jgi:hypothetical protein
MELEAPAPQQRAVGRILHQGMFEGVFRIGERAAPEDQFRRSLAAPRRHPAAA